MEETSGKLSMRVIVKCLADNSITLDVRPSETIKNTKNKILGKHVPPEQHQFLKLFFGAEQLAENRTLAEYNIVNESEIAVRLVLPHSTHQTNTNSDQTKEAHAKVCGRIGATHHIASMLPVPRNNIMHIRLKLRKMCSKVLGPALPLASSGISTPLTASAASSSAPTIAPSKQATSAKPGAPSCISQKPDWFLIFHNVAMKKNMGNILRSCAAFRVKAVICVGRKQNTSFFGSKGTRKHVDLIYIKTLDEARKFCMERQVHICGIEIMKEAERGKRMLIAYHCLLRIQVGECNVLYDDDVAA